MFVRSSSTCFQLKRRIPLVVRRATVLNAHCRFDVLWVVASVHWIFHDLFRDDKTFVVRQLSFLLQGNSCTFERLFPLRYAGGGIEKKRVTRDVVEDLLPTKRRHIP